jgi:hypothetical protein
MAELPLTTAEARVALDVLSEDAYLRVPHQHSPACIGEACPADDFTPRAEASSADAAQERAALKRKLRVFLAEA